MNFILFKDALENIVARIESFRVATSKLPSTATLGLVHRRAMLFYELSRYTSFFLE